jgi:hypothetical protein
MPVRPTSGRNRPDVIVVEDPSLAPGTVGMTYEDGTRIDLAPDGTSHRTVGPSFRPSLFPDPQLGEWLVAAFGPVASDHDGFVRRLYRCDVDAAALERLEAATYEENDRPFALTSVHDASARMREPATEGVDMVAVAAWAEAGFPRVQLGHRLAASLMATHVPDDVLAEVVPPWPAFQMDLPGGLLHRTIGGQEYPVTTVIASHDDGRWAYFALREGGTAGFRRGMSAEQIGRILQPDDFDPKTPFPSIADADQRLTAVIGRLLINVCLELSSPECELKQSGSGHGDWRQRSKRGATFPIGPRVYCLRRQVKVDVRQAVTDYVRGGGSSPSIQIMVRGHWKHQAHGPGLSLRKRIHVEPYWRGPEDGPIALRPHVLKENGRGEGV